MNLTELRKTLADKVEQLKGMDITDEKFKDATNAVCNLAETTSKLENTEKDQELKEEENKLKKLEMWFKIGLGAVTGVAVPLVINTLNHTFKRNMAHESWTYEKDGVVMSPTSKNFVNDSFKDDKN
jgi:hypothetical protein